jgi:hippurate hydrolase
MVITNQGMKEILKAAKCMQKELAENRRKIHAYAEVGFGVEQTNAFIKERLERIGLSVKKIGRAGLACVINEKGKGNALLLRADTDALLIKERSGEKFAAKNGCMHACGHDMHAAILLGVARVLKEREHLLKTPVKLLFQPAEEILSGAKDCVEFGVLTEPKVDRAAALHVAINVPFETGTVIVPSVGVSAPAADYFQVQIKGKGCHGSAPQNGIDPLIAAAHILLALQEINARELSAHEPAVLTIGIMKGGDAGNAIAETAVLEGTLRAFDDQVRERIKKRILEMSQQIAKCFRAKAIVRFFSGCPCLVNDEKMRENFLKCVGQVFDERLILRVDDMQGGDLKRKSGGSEDFAVISQKVPSVFFSLAAGEQAKGYREPLHSPKARFDENAMPYGVAALSALALYGK